MKKLAWAFASIALCAASAAAAQPAPPSPVAGVTLEIGAEGEVKARPDMASLDLGVSVSASSAKAALGEAGARMSRLLAALKDAGIADRDIATAEISLSPQYAYQQGEAPRLTGYQASERAEGKVHDLARLGPIIDAAVAAGASEVGAVQFSLSDPAAAEDEARSRAVAALRARAELYGRLLGEPDMRLVRLTEAGAGESPPPPRPLYAARTVMEAVTPISPGETTVRVNLSAEFQLSR